LGLHARAAAQFVKLASQFSSEVFVRKDSNEVNGKSIMGILMLAAAKGSKVTVRTEGNDSGEAMEALGQLIENKFGEK
jgi:phosphocarrier protein